MHKLSVFFISCICMFFSACLTQDQDPTKSPFAPGMEKFKPFDSANLTTIQWMDSVQMLPNTMEGQKVQVVFKFKNTGQKPLIIQSAQPSCGCTVPSKPDEPIMPGKEGKIKAIFDSEGRPGSAHKTILVHANTSPSQSHTLEFNLQVISKTDGPKAVGNTPQGL